MPDTAVSLLWENDTEIRCVMLLIRIPHRHAPPHGKMRATDSLPGAERAFFFVSRVHLRDCFHGPLFLLIMERTRSFVTMQIDAHLN